MQSRGTGEQVGQDLTQIGTALESPLRGLYGLTRGAQGYLSQEADPLGNAANVARQPIDVTAQQVGDYILDETGSPVAATVGNVFTQINPLSPF